MKIKIPNWLFETKRVEPDNCIRLYNEKLAKKLGFNGFLPFEKCREEVRKYKLTYKNYRLNRKPNWPSNPNITYKNSGWNGWSDFLRTQIVFEELRKEVRKHKFKTCEEYIKKRNPDWPARPNKVYKKDWVDWDDFFGREKQITLKELRKEVRKCKFKSSAEYKRKRKPHWPSNPNFTYKNSGWIEWYDLLGKNKKYFPSFIQLRKEVRKRKFKNQYQYANPKNRKLNWPSNPDDTYKNSGWKGWHDFLGNKKPPKLLSFTQCCKEARKCKFKGREDYLKHKRKNWPSCPDHVYKEWKGWRNFLGNEKNRPPLNEFRKEIRAFKFKNRDEYLKNRKPHWPTTPERTYKKSGWKNWADLLGN